MSSPTLIAEPPAAPPEVAPAAGPSPPAPAAKGSVWGVLPRMYLAAAVLAVGAGLQIGLLLYVRAGGTPPAANLESPLKTLPLKLGQWQGEDVEITDRNALYGNEHLKRRYFIPGTRQEVYVWMVYSRLGLDRDHHPEVCYAVKGKREIASERKSLNIDSLANAAAAKASASSAAPREEGAPVEVFCFGDERQSQWVYYWTYTLPMPAVEGLDVVRRTYHRMRTPLASVTAEVFSTQRRGARTTEVEAFVVELDTELQKIVGESANRNSERKPFTVLPTDQEPAQE